MNRYRKPIQLTLCGLLLAFSVACKNRNTTADVGQADGGGVPNAPLQGQIFGQNFQLYRALVLVSAVAGQFNFFLYASPVQCPPNLGIDHISVNAPSQIGIYVEDLTNLKPGRWVASNSSVGFYNSASNPPTTWIATKSTVQIFSISGDQITAGINATDRNSSQVAGTFAATICPHF